MERSAAERSAGGGRIRRRGVREVGAFSLLEVLLATVILSLILVLIMAAFNQTSAIFRRGMAEVSSLREARLAFDLLTRTLSQATLNTYLDYDYLPDGRPKRYLRNSDLKFFSGQAGVGGVPGLPDTGQAVFFQAPLGVTEQNGKDDLNSLMNACGFYVDFGPSPNLPSHIPASQNPARFRLMRLLIPAESNKVFTAADNDWFTAAAATPIPVADHVIALILRPLDPATSELSAPVAPNDRFEYDTSEDAEADPQPVTAHQLPPIVEVTMVAIDEGSARQLEAQGTYQSVLSSLIEGRFLTRANFESDLAGLVTDLDEQRIRYHLYSSAVPLRESNWTK